MAEGSPFKTGKLGRDRSRNDPIQLHFCFPAVSLERRAVLRTHDLGSLRSEHIGQTVTLAGWVARRRDHGGVAFVDLRDASGVAQVVVREEEVFHGLRNEYVLQIIGTVSKRPEGNENPALATGEIEVMAEKVVILNTSDPLPFQVDEHVEVGEE